MPPAASQSDPFNASGSPVRVKVLLSLLLCIVSLAAATAAQSVGGQTSESQATEAPAYHVAPAVTQAARPEAVTTTQLAGWLIGGVSSSRLAGLVAQRGLATLQIGCIEECVAEIDATGYADALAVFKVEGAGMRLLADRHMPDEWRRLVSGGVPLQPAFASAHSVMTGQPVQLGDISEMADRFSKTADHLVWAGYHACLFVPIVCGDRVWGHLGLVRRARQSFDRTGTSYLKTACAVFALRVGDEAPA